MKEIDYNKKLYLFEMDDVLFARKEYIIQVYYLFASFYEFSEGTVKANDLATFMKKVYDYHGEEKVFDAAKEVFGIAEKYKENLNRLMANAQLPLRLLLKPDIERLIIDLISRNIQIGILTKGNPVEQLNKLKFIDWNQLADFKNNFKIYFVDELTYRSLDPTKYIAEQHNLDLEDLFLFDKN